MLHIVNKSPFEKCTLESCLRIARPGHALLLIEDGVYAAVRGNAFESRIRQVAATMRVYALGPDLAARGMKTAAIDGIELVDYAGFVDLVATHDTVQSWL
ncbi:MAG TPA: sulfurtransferase complex subunit TusB [Casimicrobiaceae bacterium]|jgi:tRNA 2-thiouridine synthesizing protein B|nr:sulfurtransferase complex subunit TusB [Casimicrobiaceae bacterium]